MTTVHTRASLLPPVPYPVDLTGSLRQRINPDTDWDESWSDTPYVVVPPFTARVIAHWAIEATGYLPTDTWGNSSLVYVRTRCGRTRMLADRWNGSWSRLCRRCFPPHHEQNQASAQVLG